MSDQSPPSKPKPGSLRDRIAAFENKGTSLSQTGPPPPRPKPGGLQWKPRPPSPPASTDSVQPSERKIPSTGGMSASDAMESIGRGGSLKERMAALQGKGAFGGPPPPIAPKPNVERQKWKPPPAVPAPAGSETDTKEGIDEGAREASRSPPPRPVGSPAPENQHRDEGDVVAQEGDGGDLDGEEEERQRRAAIAARMARLGGARLGMGPPIFTPKPVVRKPESIKEDSQGDQPTAVRESDEASATPPPRDLPAATSPTPEAVTETEHKDDLESPPPVPVRAPTSMPVPVGPRRTAPPRKKSSKNAPTTALPEPPAGEPEAVAVQLPAVSNEPFASVDRNTHDASLATNNSRMEASVEKEETCEEHRDTTNAERGPGTSPTIEGFHKPIEKQEAEAEPIETAASHAEEESVYTPSGDRKVSTEQPSRAVEEEEEEEARRQRVAAKLAQMGAFNPLAAPPLVPPRQQSFDEAAPYKAPLDVEDEVNVDTEEYGETTPSPPIVSSRRDTVQSIKRDPAAPHANDAKVDAGNQVVAHRDGERTVASYTEEQSDGHGGRTKLEDPPVAYDSVRPTQGTASTEVGAPDVPGTTRLGADVQDRLHVRDLTTEHEAPNIEPVANTPPPMPAPPANLRSKPTPPSTPPPKTTLQALKADEDVCPPSPDMPPRPIPPPGRSGSISSDVPSPPPRRSIPPPPRRTSVRVADPLGSPPASPPPGPTSPRPANRRPDTPPIITTLVVQDQVAPGAYEKERVTEEETVEAVTPRPDGPEDEESARRRAIADRMARLGGIRFGALPTMNPLSRPPLPSAPPPTSIPPDELEEEEDGAREGEEDDAARKQRVAVKLAGTGGMRLGMLSPPALARRIASKQEDSESEDVVLPVPVPPPSQRAPPTRKPPPPVEQEGTEPTKGDSRGTSDDGVQVEAEESEMEEVRYSDAEVPVGSEEEEAPALPPPRRSMQTVSEALPTPPPRMTSHSPSRNRPPIPTIPTLLGRRPSGTTGSVSVSSSRQASLDEPSPDETPTLSGSILRPHSEYVMVEAEDGDGRAIPISPIPPRRTSTRGSGRAVPVLPPVPPPSAIDPPEALSGSAQWELASIPQGAEGGEDMTSSGWSEDSTAVHAPTRLSLSPSSSRSVSGKVISSTSVSGSVTGSGSGGRRSMDQQQQQQLTTDELMTIWGKTGVRVVESATALYDKSKRALVGDGSYAGFVRAVLAQVPGATYPGVGNDVMENDGGGEWGYVVYAQTGGLVQRRVSDIMPGDVIAFWDAKLKGHKGLHAYTQTAGVGASPSEGGGGGGGGTAPSPLVGIVSEFDGKKSKVRVWQANQHVGQQTVENVSYRLEDLKSGQVKVYRVLQA